MKKFGGVYNKTIPQGVTGIQQAIEVKDAAKQSAKSNAIAMGMIKADVIKSMFD